jgi:hypothetical protein
VVTPVTDSRDYSCPSVAQMTVFSAPAPDVFDSSFSLEGGLNDSQDSQDSHSHFDFLASLMASEPTNPDFISSLNVDIPAWNEAVFGESPSQESTSSSSSWELTVKESPPVEMGTGMDIDMRLQFPSVSVDAIGDGTSMPTEDEFLRAIMEAVQSSPKMVGLISYIIVPSTYALIRLIRVDSIRWFGGSQSPSQDGFELFCETGDFFL